MSWGRIGVFALVATALVAGAAMYYLQVYAFYDRLVPAAAGAQIRLTTLAGQVEPILADDFDGIDSDSSPIRYRACFTTPQSLAMMTETYQPYAGALPLNAPGWFSCFDAGAIETALASGRALAFLGEKNIHFGVDRVVAVLDDGRAFAWNQLNDCGKTDYTGTPTGEACPTRQGSE